MTERERVEGMLIENRLSDLKSLMSTLTAAEETVNTLRDRKWILVEELKELGHNFKTTCEGMDIVLYAPPSMRF